MLDRRLFLKAGVMSAVPLATGAVLTLGAGQAAAQPAVPLHTVVYDERYADSVAFAQEARWMGQRTSAIRGDVTQLWYDDLYHRWQKGPAAIAGLTTPDAFFCLEQFGNDAGLRRVLAVEHRIGERQVEHHLTGAKATVSDTALAQCGSQWSGHMAQLLTGCSAARADRTTITVVSSLQHANQVGHPVLVSWLMAPRQRSA